MTRKEWIEQYKDLVKVVIASVPHQKEDTEDLISEGMIALIRAVDTFDQERGIKFATYASRCIRNAVRAYYRKEPKRNQIELVEGDILSEQVFYEAGNREEKELLLEAMRTLTRRERLMIDLHFGLTGTEFSQMQIAEFFGVSQSTISREEKRILRILKEKLEQ